MVDRYFAYGSNMNPGRVRERGIRFTDIAGARLSGYRLEFDKASSRHAGVGHANVVYAPGSWVEGVLYWLAQPREIQKMDPYEHTPINYSRDIVEVEVGDSRFTTWTYFANPAVRQAGLKPPRSYLDHLLAGREFLSAGYYSALAQWDCDESR